MFNSGCLRPVKAKSWGCLVNLKLWPRWGWKNQPEFCCSTISPSPFCLVGTVRDGDQSWADPDSQNSRQHFTLNKKIQDWSDLQIHTLLLLLWKFLKIGFLSKIWLSCKIANCKRNIDRVRYCTFTFRFFHATYLRYIYKASVISPNWHLLFIVQFLLLALPCTLEAQAASLLHWRLPPPQSPRCLNSSRCCAPALESDSFWTADNADLFFKSCQNIILRLLECSDSI